MRAESDRIDSYVWKISFVVIIGSIMSVLDTTIVNVALATLARELHSTISQIQWVVTGYMLSLAAVIPISGWAARRFGAKNIYLLSVIMFTLGSALCGFAQSSTELIVFRVIQGIGGGMILPLGQLIMAEAAGPKRMGRVMSIVAIPAMLGPIFGPTLGGIILENMSWRWIFFVNVPVGAFALIRGIRVLPKVAPGPADRLDFVGLAMIATGLPLITYGLAEIGTLGTFDSGRVIIPCLAGVALVVAFILHALRVPQPLLRLTLYRRPTFSSASFAMFCLGAALFGGLILLPLYWQDVRHMSVIDTGLLSSPQGLGMALIMPLSGKLAERYGGGPIALFGVLLTTAATIPFALIGLHTSIVGLAAAMVLRGMGIGFAFMPAMTAAFASLERSELSDATPQLNVLQRVGGSMGTALLAVILQRELSGAHTAVASASAYGTAFWYAAGLTALAIVPCIILVVAERRARAAKLAQPAVDSTLLSEAVPA